MIGSTIGHYSITAKLGEGGMGVVYRAHDTQLGREVALKVLPDGFAADRERLARFEREAKLLASLNHPNIAQIYGFDASGETRALVMELVEGPTLAERLEREPMPIAECLAIARQIAVALEEAHDKGIVHRDLKPQNVKVSDDDQVKVLDFGLAKAVEESGGGSTASQLALSPTITFGATVEGVILGTAAYMAPEQAAGKALDRRADIWAFGVVLWEMLTGRSLFAAGSVPETLAGVLRTEIDFDALPPATPAAIRRLLRRCLERQPRARLRDIGDARIVLDEVLAGRLDGPSDSPSSEAAPAARAGLRPFWLVAALVLGAATVAILDRTALAPPAFEPPTMVPLTYSGFDSAPDVSPDGKTVAFVSRRDGRTRIWLKQLSTGEEVALTEGLDAQPRFSPDGGSIAFSRFEAPTPGVYRIPLVGGEPRRLARDGAAPTWSPDGKWIAFVRQATKKNEDSLILIPTEGGPERELARVTERNLIVLDFAPDGSRIAARTAGRQNFAGQQELITVDVASGATQTVLPLPGGSVGGGLTWSGNQALLSAIGATQATKGPFTLVRVPLDGGPQRSLLSLNSMPRSIAHAGAGSLVVDAPEVRANLRVIELENAEPRASLWLSRGASVDRQPSLSPDGSWLVFTSDRGGSLDIWALSLDASRLRRLTHDDADDWDPFVTPDGKSLLWSSNRGGNYEIWRADVDGSGAVQVSRNGVDAENPTTTPDGEWIVFSSAKPGATGLWKMRRDGSEAERFLTGSFTIPELSPDGRWVVATDANTLIGTDTEMRVVRLEDGAEVARLSVVPGTIAPGLFGLVVGRARWLPDSRTLVFVSALDDDPSVIALFAQPIEPGRDTRSARRLLYRSDSGAPIESFGISPDGKRLVVALFEQHSDLALIKGLPGLGTR